MSTSFEKLSVDEVAIYDRQIRLWGGQMQKKLMESEILILGLSPINFELLKNIVLAGINVTLWDNVFTRTCDLECNFFLEVTDIGKQRTKCIDKIKEMNPMTNISLIEECEFKKIKDLYNYSIKKKYDAVAVSLDEEVEIELARSISHECHSDKVFFSLSISMGSRIFLFFNNYTFSFNELLELEIQDLIEKMKRIKNLHPSILVTMYILRRKYKKIDKDYTDEILQLAEALKTNPKLESTQLLEMYNSMNSCWGTTISPIASIGGGILCQEITKFCIQEPSEYFCCLFDMELCEAIVATIQK